MKKHYISLALAVVVIGIGISFATPTVFGGGDGTRTGGSTGTGMAGKNCGNCQGSYNPSMGALGVGSWKDTNNDGRLSTGDRVSGGGGGGGGGSGRNGGGGQPQSRSCVITLSAPVVASGTPSMALSWTPTPSGAVTLRRTGPTNNNRDRVALTVPNNARTFTDSITSLKPGTYTYSLSYNVPRGAVRGESTSTVEEMLEEAGTMEIVPVSSYLDGLREFAFGFLPTAYADHVSGGDSGDSGMGRADGSHSGGGGGGGIGRGSGGGSNSSGYSCTASFKVVATLTQCNDGVDNGDSEDTLADQNDPGCHTDGNPGNTRTYDPLDTSEGNPNADLVPTVTTVTKARAKRPVRVTASVKNNSAYYAVSNSLVYGWRDTSSNAKAPKCGKNNKNCFTENGHTFLRLNTYTRAYNAGQTRQDNTRSFRPAVNGRYEVCAIADFNNTVTEGSAGEANNHTCRIITVDDTAEATPEDDSTVDGPLTITASPSVMRRGQTSTVKWDTGGRTMCSITNSTTEAISFIDADGDPRITDEEESPALTAQTTYTITCTDPGYEATETATIRILPEFREI